MTLWRGLLWVQGAIERRIPSKKKLRPIPGAYRAARKATWGGLWPSWVGVSDHHLTNAKEREVRAVLYLAADTCRVYPCGGAHGGTKNLAPPRRSTSAFFPTGTALALPGLQPCRLRSPV